jgi:hypothetical protein
LGREIGLAREAKQLAFGDFSLKELSFRNCDALAQALPVLQQQLWLEMVVGYVQSIAIAFRHCRLSRLSAVSPLRQGWLPES